MPRKFVGSLLRAAGIPVMSAYQSKWRAEPRPLLPLRQLVTAKFLLNKVFRYGDGLQLAAGLSPTSVRPPVEHPLSILWQMNPTVFSDWSLSEETVFWLWQFLHVRKPQVIWEFGSGVSTIVFATYVHLQNAAGRKCHFISFEHDADWIKTTKERLQTLGLGECALVINAPLITQERFGRCYDLGQLKKVGEVSEMRPDLCLIDGPPNYIGREATLPVAAAYFGERTHVLLDDAFRDSELRCCHVWEKLTTANVVCKGIVPLPHGLAVFEVTKSKPVSFVQ